MTRHILKDPDELTLADVDGTVPGRAVLVSVNMRDPDSKNGVMHSTFTEGEAGCTDPCGSAYGFWAASEDDWPDHVPAVVMNDRANHLRLALIGIADTPQEYVHMRKSNA